MYQRILVPVDGSATATRGLDEAMRLARLTGASLRLVHVVDELAVALSSAQGAYVGDLYTRLREGGEAVLKEAQARVEAAGLRAETVLHDTFQGRICDLVVQEAQQWPADVIVIGTHGRRGVGRVMMGSDAEQILRAAPVPVLLVRAQPNASA